MGLQQNVWRTGMILGLGLLGLACGGTDIDAPLADTTDTDATAADTTTTAPEEPTSSTADTDAQQAQALNQEDEAARAEIEEVVIKWYTYPWDTSKGTDGVPLQYTSGLLNARVEGAIKQRTDDGQIQRSRGSTEAAVISIELDLEAGTAEVEMCGLGDHELVDAETDEVIHADEDPPATGQVLMERTPEGWRASDYFYSGAGGSPVACDLP